MTSYTDSDGKTFEWFPGFDAEGDVIVKSNDGKAFKTHSYHLKNHSSILHLELDGLAQQNPLVLTMDAPGAALCLFLGAMHNVPGSVNIDDIESAIAICERYLATHLGRYILNAIIDQHTERDFLERACAHNSLPIRLFRLASRVDDRSSAHLLLCSRTLYDWLHNPSNNDMKEMPGSWVWAVLRALKKVGNDWNPSLYSDERSQNEFWGKFGAEVLKVLDDYDEQGTSLPAVERAEPDTSRQDNSGKDLWLVQDGPWIASDGDCLVLSNDGHMFKCQKYTLQSNSWVFADMLSIVSGNDAPMLPLDAPAASVQLFIMGMRRTLKPNYLLDPVVLHGALYLCEKFGAIAAGRRILQSCISSFSPSQILSGEVIALACQFDDRLSAVRVLSKLNEDSDDGNWFAGEAWGKMRGAWVWAVFHSEKEASKCFKPGESFKKGAEGNKWYWEMLACEFILSLK